MDELPTITFSGPLTIDKERLARRLSDALPHWLEDEATKPVTVAIALNEAPPEPMLRDFTAQMESVAEYGGTLPRPDMEAISCA